MRHVDPGMDFDSWRPVARTLLAGTIPPDEILWEADASLFACAPTAKIEYPQKAKEVAVPAQFVELARTVACHAEPSRWALLYRILWRITRLGERRLLEIASDRDMAKARSLEKSVRREIHKMHAFVRFRKTGEAEDGRERFVAWFEPDHFIVKAASPFFQKRFTNMDWSIFTPKGCAHWLEGELVFTAGFKTDPSACADEWESVWETYYRSIFNPARLKLKAMQAEMPKRYWKNLPEARLIDSLVRESTERVNGMLEATPRPVRREPKNAYLSHLRSLSAQPREQDLENHQEE